MTKPYRIATIVGARPQFIKAAALSRVLTQADGLEEVLIHTGQHFDDNMSEIFFRELSIPKPAFNLAIHGGPHGEMTGKMLIAIEQTLKDAEPDMVLVYGDTNSTLAGALAAAKMHIPVAHVEAGLRSFNRRMPEEVNRVLTDHVSALLFCPTDVAIKNLASEGISKGVLQTGDVMFDATLFAREAARKSSNILGELDITAPFGLCTIHRSENTDDLDRLRAILKFVEENADGVPIVFPVHPRTRQVFERHGIAPNGMKLVAPVGYLDLHRLLSEASFVFTDSGGLQKEAYFHRVPCTTLRDETEWVETIEAGWNRLWTSPDYNQPRRDVPDYGAGKAAEEIAAAIGNFLNEQSA